MKKIIVAFIFALGAQAFASEQISTATPELEEEYTPSFGLTLGYSTGAHKLNHQEASFSSGFVSPDKATNIQHHGIDIGIMQEVFASYRMSVTALISGGVQDGDDNGPGFTDEMEGVRYGGGGSFNYNFYASGLKVQPYVAAQFMFIDQTFRFDGASGATPLNFEYDLRTQNLEYSLGVRFHDFDSGLMSYISVNYIDTIGRKIQTNAKVSGAEVALNQEAQIDTAPVIIGLGFGFIF